MGKLFGNALLCVIAGVCLTLLGTVTAEAQGPLGHDEDLNPAGKFPAWHAPGYLDPLNQGCTQCHGNDLRTGIFDSCYDCHGDYWTYGDADMTQYPENASGGFGVLPQYEPYIANPVQLYPDSHTVEIGDIMPLSQGDSGIAWACWYCHPSIYGYVGPDKLSYFHAPGHGTPYQSGCDQCHGSNLQNGADGFAISCRWCHQNQWVEPDTVPWPDRVPPDHRNLSTYGAPSDIGSQLMGGFAWHRRGWDNPYSIYDANTNTPDGCTRCHGPNLDDGFAPSCFSCHGPGGEGLPSTHDQDKNGAMHLPGYDAPMDNCTQCHGANLEGGYAPACSSCHGANGEPPADHDQDKMGFMHKLGYEAPYDNGCTACHGANLEGGLGPSCASCHGANGEPPADHDQDKNNVLHKLGYDSPYDSGCTSCHGPNLEGGIATSCGTCHGGGGSAPPDHDQDKNGVMHKLGYEAPFDNGCTACHGSELNNGFATSCFTCHAATWADHDFAGRSWVPEYMVECFVCHAEPDIPSGGWKHTLSPTTDYQVSTTTMATVGNPTESSRMCMSCHEGNIAVDDFEGTLSNPPSEFIVGKDALGKNLRQHHPVSFPYSTMTASAHGALNDPMTSPSNVTAEGTIAEDLLEDGQLQCTACHEQHFKVNDNYLVNTGNDLCFTCHTFADTTLTAHHIPGRDDPWGLMSGTKFNCTYCHGEDLQGANGAPACVECHEKWDPTDPNQSSPADPDVPTSHHGLYDDRDDPLNNCIMCHGDEATGQLTGSVFGGNETPSCGQCHADRWSTDPPSPGFTIDAGGPYDGIAGEATTVRATFTLPEAPSEGDTLVASLYPGDGTPPPFPTHITFTGGAWDSELTFSHAFPVGETTGRIVLADGNDQTTEDTFTVNVVDPDAAPTDRWYVEAEGGSVFHITTTGYGSDGVFTAEKDDGSVAFGIATDDVIFWIDMIFTAESWAVGNTYFGNIDRDTGTITGIVITTTGSVETFTAVRD